MSERKVLSKYYPPDFDPSKIPRAKKTGRPEQQKVRLMAPFSMRCTACGEFIARGKKFNARKETVQGEVYLSIKVYRFYIRCPRCAAEITYKTDPKNSDYVAEHGATRNVESWREDLEALEERKKRVKERLGGDKSEAQDDEEDPMKALERRTVESKREMEILNALDEIRTRNARAERINKEQLLETVHRKNAEAGHTEQTEIDDLAAEEALVSTLFPARSSIDVPIDQETALQTAKARVLGTTAAVKEVYRRSPTAVESTVTGKRPATSNTLGVVLKPKKPKPADSQPPTVATAPAVSSHQKSKPVSPPKPAAGLSDLLGGYSSSDSDGDTD
ncbi:Pre-mRNA-splicing factor cwf16 [Dispira parvispora]|uniref:Splicing factor YJU2 n=1 Tax=Dispira parvispora TaxID=1520584 RepID=A0A9W8AQQ1_9FUNG|nr:Pre-mRNA-splicing factor cwf16 [Dispira parvispora]